MEDLLRPLLHQQLVLIYEMICFSQTILNLFLLQILMLYQLEQHHLTFQLAELVTIFLDHKLLPQLEKIRQKLNKKFELPDNMPELELGDDLVKTLGTEAKDLFDPRAPPTKKRRNMKFLRI